MISSIAPQDVNHKELAGKLLQDTPILYVRLSEKCGITHDLAPDWMREVIRFLHLIAYSGERLTPSVDVDNVWHEFILCTRTYMDFCESQFGRFVHHYPGGTEDENQRQFKRTLELYKGQFGRPKPLYWGGYDMTNPESGCGPCEGT
ncbi:MAG: hypothetical protein OEZ36_05425 [Spirochaetota bacterium]|nr:hypothetical protein [Spirochaetota bacterium]